MIILSQDKTEIINLGNVINVNISDCGEEGYLISAGFIVGRDDNYRDLGYYQTEERAKEVLQQLLREYENCNCESYSAGFGYVSNAVYEMPEK